MKQQEQRVYNRVVKTYTIELEDVESVQQVIKDCLVNGYTEDDAFKFVICMEEVNPELEEYTACLKMSAITKKYTDGLETRIIYMGDE